MRGRVCAKLKILPSDPLLRNSSDEELVFVEHYLDKQDETFWNKLSKLLGVLWEKSDVVETDSNGVINKLFIPLLAGIKPEVMTVVKKLLTSNNLPQEFQNEEFQDLGNVDKESFKKMLNIFDGMAKD